MLRISRFHTINYLTKISRRSISNTRFRFYEEIERSPEEILETGFKNLALPNATKTPELLDTLIRAGEKLDISETEITEIYDSVEPGTKEYEDLTPSERREVNEMDQELFGNLEDEQNAFQVYEYDDMPTLGHLQLREHRIQRDYNRIAAYELPQLTQYAQEYRPRIPNKQVLKFRQTIYFGEEHPGNSKVVLTFNPEELDLDKQQLHKLKLLAGPRYDYTKDEIKIASDKFNERAQNKRYIADILQDLLEAARDKTDTFEDVPLDFRHIEARTRRHKQKYPTYEFPEEWKRPQDAPKPPEGFEERLFEIVKGHNIATN